MPNRYEIHSDGLIRLHSEKSVESAPTGSVGNRDIVVAVADNPENDNEWMFVNFGLNIEGWVQTKYLGDPQDPAPLPLDKPSFVRTCTRAELLTDGSSDELGAIVADFLIAWALIETEIDNPGPNLQGSDAIGPFRITAAQWTQYMTAVNSAQPYVFAHHRAIPNMQVFGATYLAQTYAKAFSILASPSPAPADGPFVPSYLNVYHCHMLGAASAFHFQKLKDDGKGSEKVDAALAQHIPNATDRNAILENFRGFTSEGNNFVTVETFFARTGDAMDHALGTAYGLIRDHAPYLLPPPSVDTTQPAWLPVAQQEFELWHQGNLNEKSVEGLALIDKYFAAINYENNGAEAWCGAFVGYCLKEAGFGDTIVKSPAWAANWVNWGNTKYRLHHGKKIPKGAIVVTYPLAKGSSGHVAFFHNTLPENKIALLGGNQRGNNGDSVTISQHIKKTQVRAILWLDVTPSTSAESGADIPGSPVNANEGDVLILARTLFGEARNQSQLGMEAVACVVTNRARNRFRGASTVSEVCLARKQFSCWNRNDPNYEIIRNKNPNTGDSKFDLCHGLALAAVRNQINNPFQNDNNRETMHYHATYIAVPSWVGDSPNAVVTLREGSHIFYKGIA